jgi:ubiquinone/menaquinone biosynthesis C-methylase UbiE
VVASFVPLVLDAADVQPGDRVLDVGMGTGEAAVAIIPAIGASGRLIGADIAPAMLESARDRPKGADLFAGSRERASVAIRCWHL